MMRASRLWLTVPFVVVFLSTGCFTIGPRAVSDGRIRYNRVIQETSYEQLLLNLVRLRYRESPYFLGVASVSQSLEGGVSGSGSGTFPSGGSDTFGLSFEPSYLEKPSITYTPLQGEDFVRQMLSPIEYEKMALLLNSGWSVSRTFRLLVQEMNGLLNAPSASGPTPSYQPEFRDFRRAVDLLRELEIRGQSKIVLVQDGEDRALALYIDPAADETTEAREFRRLMGLDPDLSQYLISGSSGDDHITIVPRPLVASMFYLSQSVRVPEEHRQRGLVTLTMASGKEFDWNEVTGQLMRIESTKSKRVAKRNAIRVSYRDYWYYVPDDDLESKSTFLLLLQILSLQAGEMPSMGPVLTLPVSR